MTARRRMIVAQTLATTAVVAFVVLVFLRPFDQQDLSGIEAGSGPPRAATTNSQKPSQQTNGGKRDRKGPDSIGADGQGVGGGSAPGGAIPGTAAPGAGGASPGSSSSGDSGDTPTGSQYGDAVARLLERVDSADPEPGE